MKKIILILTACILLFSLIGCSTEKELDYKSAKDTTSNAVISIGDSKADIDKALGDPEYNSNLEGYEYTNGLMINYDSNNTVIYMQASTNNFELINYKPGDSQDMLENNFEFFNAGDPLFYTAYYDENGTRCEKDVSIYSVGIVFSSGEYTAFYIGQTSK